MGSKLATLDLYGPPANRPIMAVRELALAIKGYAQPAFLPLSTLNQAHELCTRPSCSLAPSSQLTMTLYLHSSKMKTLLLRDTIIKRYRTALFFHDPTGRIFTPTCPMMHA
ncbi:hypothetical protein MVEN_02170300 [Mycena venus]|uniref:Uncharacterized protein n=1 Tax=Mycena venus TaxID=2733690 RepID=A0A8H6X7X4_9AGAR|nr:hypothetical protein MVEN_02170300 [Mycena venus]